MLKFTIDIISSQQKYEGENPTADAHDKGHFRNLRIGVFRRESVLGDIEPFNGEGAKNSIIL